VVVAGNQKMWSALCKALGVPQLTYDERFLDQERRATNQSELAALLAPVFSRRSAEHWIKVLDAVGIATAVINDFGQALSDPQLSELDLLQEVRLPNGSNQLMLEFPVLMSTLEANIYAPPPLLGEHNDEVLRQWLGTERSARSARSDSDRET
jgi:crotonobetainyl-CoA:carnitine CoA-transferase CaiB-like acyl-CoA transferase